MRGDAVRFWRTIRCGREASDLLTRRDDPIRAMGGMGRPEWSAQRFALKTADVPAAFTLLVWNGLLNVAPKHVVFVLLVICAVTEVTLPGTGTVGSGRSRPWPFTSSFGWRASPAAPACRRIFAMPASLAARSPYFQPRPFEYDAQR